MRGAACAAPARRATPARPNAVQYAPARGGAAPPYAVYRSSVSASSPAFTGSSSMVSRTSAANA